MKEEDYNWLKEAEEEAFWDDMSGEMLNPQGVKAARQEELEYARRYEVFDIVDVKRCWERTGKAPIKVRWVDVNKGDKLKPEYRSRLVAKEINTYKREDLFAATPPLEAKKLLFILAVTAGVGWHYGKKKQMKLDFIDVRRAYWCAKARREVYVDVPPEMGLTGKCARLKKSMYGTRDAAQNWEFEYSEFLISPEMGFVKGKASTCVFLASRQAAKVCGTWR